MEANDTARTITEARGCAELGLFSEAWDLVESLPAASRLNPPAVAVRLLVCTGLRKWEMGAEITRHVRPDFPPAICEAAGRFHLADAEALCAAGDVEGAKEGNRLSNPQSPVRAFRQGWLRGDG